MSIILKNTQYNWKKNTARKCNSFAHLFSMLRRTHNIILEEMESGRAWEYLRYYRGNTEKGNFSSWPTHQIWVAWLSPYHMILPLHGRLLNLEHSVESLCDISHLGIFFDFWETSTMSLGSLHPYLKGLKVQLMHKIQKTWQEISPCSRNKFATKCKHPLISLNSQINTTNKPGIHQPKHRF